MLSMNEVDQLFGKYIEACGCEDPEMTDEMKAQFDAMPEKDSFPENPVRQRHTVSSSYGEKRECKEVGNDD